MAGNVVERLIIEIGGDARKFKDELKSLKRANKDGEKSFQNLALVGKAGFLAVAAAATALAVASTKSFIAFEKGVTNVAKTTNLAGQELEDFKKEIMDLSEEIPATTDQLLEIATAAGQLGIKGTENLVVFTETIAKLGATTDLEGENAAIQIARILNLTDEGTETVDKFGSTIVDLGNNFATSESQILDVAAEVAKATVNFNLASPEILGMSAAMSSLGIQAEAGSTVVGQAFAAIDVAVRGQGGPAFEKLIELTGMTGEEMTRVFQDDAASVFQSFIQGLGKAGKSGKAMRDELHALGLSGIRVEKILPTLAERSDILTDALKRAAKASEDNTALNKEAAAAFETAAARLVTAQNRINNSMIKMGAEIAPAYAKAMENAAKSVEENEATLTIFGKAIAWLIEDLGNMTSDIGRFFSWLSEDLSLAKRNIENVVFTIIGFFLALNEATGDIFGKIGENFNKLNAFLLDKEKKIHQAIFDLLPDFLKIGEKAKEGTDKAAEAVEENSKSIATSIADLIKKYRDAGKKWASSDDETTSKLEENSKKRNSVQKAELEARKKKRQEEKEAAEAAEKEKNAKIIKSAEERKKRIEQIEAERLANQTNLNNAELEILRAIQEGKSEIEIEALRARFDQMREENSINNQLLKLQEKDNLSKQEMQLSDHLQNLLVLKKSANKKKEEEAKKEAKRLEAIEEERLIGQSALNAAELELELAHAQNKGEKEIEILQANFDRIKEANEINNEILRLKEKENLTLLEQQQLNHLMSLEGLSELRLNNEIKAIEERDKNRQKELERKEDMELTAYSDGDKLNKLWLKRYRENEEKHGMLMAAMWATQQDARYQGTKNAAGELSALINSENDNLKAIGKAATIVQIGISTTESAIKAFNGLAWIPVVGVGLGVLAAAAIGAYGAERINKVQQMKEGGIVPGTGRGDKIPALLEPGELVVPRDITVDLMKKLGTRQMADGGVATGAKQGKDLHKTFSDMFNPATFVKSLVYEYLGWDFDGGSGASEAGGFGAEMFGGMIGGMIGAGEKAAEELADILLNEIPGGDYIKKISKWSKLSDDKLKDIIKDIAGEGPLFDFLESMDSKLSGFLLDNILKAGGDFGGFLYNLGGSLGGVGRGLGSALGLQNGGIVPGTGSGDIVPAFLEPGELVVPKDFTTSLLNISSGFGNIQIPTSNQDRGTGVGGEKRVVVELTMNDNAAEIINAQIREGDRLGYLSRN